MLWLTALTLWLLFIVQNVAYGLRNITVNLKASDIFTSCHPAESGRVEQCVSMATWQFTGVALHYIISSHEFQPAMISIDDMSFMTHFNDFTQLPSTESEQPSLIWSVTGLDNTVHNVLITKNSSHLKGTFMFTTDEEHPTTTTAKCVTPHTPASVLMFNGLHQRAANPACIKNGTEGSCLNLAANCIDSVTAETQTTMWGIRSCAAAATCYGVADLVNSTKCQTGLDISIENQSPLNTSIYNGLARNCTNGADDCPVTQQNFIDWFYGTLKQINTTLWPSSPEVVTATWAGIVVWSATQSSVTYAKLDSWYHASCPNPTSTSCHSTPPSPSPPPPPPSPHGHTLSRGALIGIVFACMAVAGLVVVLVFNRWKRNRDQNHPPARPTYGLPDGYRIDPWVEDVDEHAAEMRPLM